jgi:beta-glucosidase
MRPLAPPPPPAHSHLLKRDPSTLTTPPTHPPTPLPSSPTTTLPPPKKVKDGTIPESRIDESVRRILQTKQWLGLFDDPVRAHVFATPGLLESVGSAEDKAASLAVARESIVLLKNGGASGHNNNSSSSSSSSSSGGRPVLPLARGTRLLVTGRGCDSLAHQIGA